MLMWCVDFTLVMSCYDSYYLLDSCVSCAYIVCSRMKYIILHFGFSCL